MTPLGAVETTLHGTREWVNFKDIHGQHCYLSTSNLFPPKDRTAWIGCNNNGVMVDIDVDLAQKLIATIQRWIDTGSFKT